MSAEMWPCKDRIGIVSTESTRVTLRGHASINVMFQDTFAVFQHRTLDKAAHLCGNIACMDRRQLGT